MNITRYIPTRPHRKVWLRAFRLWQRRPRKVAPLSDRQCRCSCCGMEYVGNFCPCCGQSSDVGRFSFKQALTLFLDVWDETNKSVYITIRDLLLRPGYMTRDFIMGMQAAYFSPFKLFFLLATFSLIAENGHNLLLGTGVEADSPMAEVSEAANYTIVNADVTADAPAAVGITDDTPAAAAVTDDTPAVDGKAEFLQDKKVSENLKKIKAYTNKFFDMMIALADANPAIFSLLSLMLISWPLFFFFRSTPRIPHLSYSEFVVALVQASNCSSIYSIFGDLFGMAVFHIMGGLMILVLFKQLSGFSKRRVFSYIVLTGIISFVILLLLVCLLTFIAYFVLRK